MPVISPAWCPASLNVTSVQSVCLSASMTRRGSSSGQTHGRDRLTGRCTGRVVSHPQAEPAFGLIQAGDGNAHRKGVGTYPPQAPLVKPQNHVSSGGAPVVGLRQPSSRRLAWRSGSDSAAAIPRCPCRSARPAGGCSDAADMRCPFRRGRLLTLIQKLSRCPRVAGAGPSYRYGGSGSDLVGADEARQGGCQPQHRLPMGPAAIVDELHVQGRRKDRDQDVGGLLDV
jgi:hypothetical protein